MPLPALQPCCSPYHHLLTLTGILVSSRTPGCAKQQGIKGPVWSSFCTEAVISKTVSGAYMERKLLLWLSLLNSPKLVASQVLLLETNPKALGSIPPGTLCQFQYMSVLVILSRRT